PASATTQPQPASTTNATVPPALQQLKLKIDQSVATELGALHEKFGTPTGRYDLSNKTITLDYNHIFSLNFKVKDTKIVLNGFHHDYKKQVEEGKIIQFSNIRSGKADCYSATLSYKDEPLDGRKNFFPASWS